LEPVSGKQYDQAEVQKNIWQKPIEQVRASDWVVSHDKDGNLVPGKVRRTFVNEAEHILDFHGTGVTPGHVYLCGDGPYKGKWRKIFDILCDDGTIVHTDGRHLRAATMEEVGSPGDAFIRVLTVRPDKLGGHKTQALQVTGNGMIRAGTKFITDDGQTVSLIQIICGNGYIFDSNAVGPGVGGVKRDFSDPAQPYYVLEREFLPAPEDYVLARSGLTKDEILASPDLHEGRPLTVSSSIDMPRQPPSGWSSWSPGQAEGGFNVDSGYASQLNAKKRVH